MNEYSVLKTSRKIFLVGLLFCLIVSVIYKNIAYSLGFILGYVISNITYQFTIKITNLILEVKNEKLFALCFIGNLIIYVMGLLLAIKLPHIFHYMTVFLGYFMIKCAIYVETFIERRMKSK